MINTTFLGNEIQLSDKCNSIWGSYREGGIYDELLIFNFYEVIKQLIENKNKKTLNFFDIGANTGSFIFLPIMNKAIKCYAFEPNKLVFDVLIENVDINNLHGNVRCFNLGMWSDIKELEMKIPIDTTDSGLATFGDSTDRFKYDDRNGEYETHIVKCKTIDTIFDELELESLDIIKIDTEGSELEILKGGINTILKYKPIILFEFDNKSTKSFGYNRTEIIELLMTYGYISFTLLATSDMLAVRMY